MLSANCGCVWSEAGHKRCSVQCQGPAAAGRGWAGDSENPGGLSWEGVGSYLPGSVCSQGTQEIETEPSGCARLPDVVWTKCKATWASRRLPQERRQPCLCRGIQWALLAVIAARVYEFWMERLWQCLFVYSLHKQSIRRCTESQNTHLWPCLQIDRWFWQHMFSSTFCPFLGFMSL